VVPTSRQGADRSVPDAAIERDARRRRTTVEKLIECPCGAVLRDTDEGALIARAQQHARETHDMELTGEQAADMVRPA
jgi:hypothetical protein